VTGWKRSRGSIVDGDSGLDFFADTLMVRIMRLDRSQESTEGTRE